MVQTSPSATALKNHLQGWEKGLGSTPSKSWPPNRFSSDDCDVAQGLVTDIIARVLHCVHWCSETYFENSRENEDLRGCLEHKREHERYKGWYWKQVRRNWLTDGIPETTDSLHGKIVSVQMVTDSTDYKIQFPLKTTEALLWQWGLCLWSLFFFRTLLIFIKYSTRTCTDLKFKPLNSNLVNIVDWIILQLARKKWDNMAGMYLRKIEIKPISTPCI